MCVNLCESDTKSNALSWLVFLCLFILMIVNPLCVRSNVDGFGLEAEARMTTWHIMIPSDIEPDGVYSQDVSEGNLRMTKPQMSHNATSVLPSLIFYPSDPGQGLVVCVCYPVTLWSKWGCVCIKLH